MYCILSSFSLVFDISASLIVFSLSYQIFSSEHVTLSGLLIRGVQPQPNTLDKVGLGGFTRHLEPYGELSSIPVSHDDSEMENSQTYRFPHDNSDIQLAKTGAASKSQRCLKPANLVLTSVVSLDTQTPHVPIHTHVPSRWQ